MCVSALGSAAHASGTRCRGTTAHHRGRHHGDCDVGRLVRELWVRRKARAGVSASSISVHIALAVYWPVAARPRVGTWEGLLVTLSEGVVRKWGFRAHLEKISP